MKPQQPSPQLHRARHIRHIRRMLIICLPMLFCFPTLASPQSSMAGHAMGTLDETPPDKYPVPEKLTGIGNVHIKITATPEAQIWFDQGLNLFHDFWDYESVRAFQQSVA